VSPKEWRFAGFPDNTDITFASCGFVNCVERVLLRVNLSNGGFSRESPLSRQITDVRDVLMGALMVGFIDACYLVFCHNCPFV